MKKIQNPKRQRERGRPESTEHARRPRSRDPHRRLSQEQLQDLGRRVRRSSGSPWRHRSSHLPLSLSSSPLLSRPLASSGLPAPVGSALVGGCPASLLQEWAGFQRGLSLWVFGKQIFFRFFPSFLYYCYYNLSMILRLMILLFSIYIYIFFAFFSLSL